MVIGQMDTEERLRRGGGGDKETTKQENTRRHEIEMRDASMIVDDR